VAGRRVLRASFDPNAGTVGAAEVVQDGAGGRPLSVTATGRVLMSPQTRTRALVTLQWLRELRDRLPQPVVSPR